MNTFHVLGRIPDQSLREIWTGAAARELRAALRADRLDLGCELCAIQVETVGAERSYLRLFDDLRPESTQPEWPRRLELALSNTCNLQCVMCNGDLSSAIRAQREHRPPLPDVYGEPFLEQLDEFLPHLRSVVLLGGEPFLAPITLQVMERLAALPRPSQVHVTTNGTIWGRRLAHLVRRLPMHVAISVDAVTPALSSAIRPGLDHRRWTRNVDDIIETVQGSGGSCSVSTCLMTHNWHEFAAILQWADLRDLDTFVNSVDAPASASLNHLPPAQLRQVVADMRQDRTAGQLQRNQSVWADTLDALARRAEHTDAERRPVTVHLRAPAERAALEPTPFAEVHVDRHQQIERVVVLGSTPVPLDPDELVGLPLKALQTALMDQLGAVTSSTLTSTPDGGELRQLRFATTALSAHMQPLDGGGELWRLSVVV